MKKEEIPSPLAENSDVHHQLVLAIDPTVRGLGYVVFRGPQEPLDWATTDYRITKSLRSLQRTKKLIRIYDPDVIVIEDVASESSRRYARVRALLDEIADIASAHNIKLVTYSPDQVREVFSAFSATTKFEIASKIVQWLPQLERLRPAKRLFYVPEDPRYGIFDAAALALTYFYLES